MGNSFDNLNNNIQPSMENNNDNFSRQPQPRKTKNTMLLLTWIIGFTGVQWFYIGKKLLGFIRLTISVVIIAIVIVMYVVYINKITHISEKSYRGILSYLNYLWVASGFIGALVVIQITELIYIAISKNLKTKDGTPIY